MYCVRIMYCIMRPHLTLSGCLLQKKLVQLDIHPKLHKEDVTAEAQRLADAALEKERRKQEEERQKREEEAQKEVTVSWITLYLDTQSLLI